MGIFDNLIQSKVGKCSNEKSRIYNEIDSDNRK